MGIAGVIFDLDGTLLDTIEDLAHSTNTVLARYGFATHDIEQYKQFVGDGMDMLIRRAIGNSSVSNLNDMVVSLKDEYAKSWFVTTKPYAGIEQVLEELSHKKIKISVLSNKAHEFTVTMVQYFFPTIHFSSIMGLQDGMPPKPNPCGALYVAQIMAVEPEHVAFIGDSGTDIEVAHRSNMYSIAVSWGYRPISLLQQHYPEAIAHTPDDILTIIEKHR
jgi:phosphoglycolate phosphatase